MPLHLHRERFLRWLSNLEQMDHLPAVKKEVHELWQTAREAARDGQGLFLAQGGPEAFTVRRDVWLAELAQVLDARTLDRARYYLRRMRNAAEGTRTGSVNDINLLRWKEYDEILTDSLWLLDQRDRSGAHLGWYWGNFVPQIPRQIMLRYTKQGEWVLDAFAGSGTTLIECRRLGRNGLGVELNPDVAERARERVAAEPNPNGVVSELVVGDSRAIDFPAVLHAHGVEQVQLLLLHPPYHDIIRFSEDPRDLSCAETPERFLEMFGEVVDRVTPCLARGRYLTLVIGDKYTRGEWIPLGFLCMQEVLRRGYRLKSIVVKNFQDTRGKRNQEALWRYRALAGGFYVFRHEYIMVFLKRQPGATPLPRSGR
ncbi:MAG: TRM11 family SAM-dependent methyltransferase [Chloroflexia bacterium]